MHYIGSKRVIADKLLEVILKNREPNQYFADLFAGAFHVVERVDGNRIANDINPYLITLFKALQNGWQPPLNMSVKRNI